MPNQYLLYFSFKLSLKLHNQLIILTHKLQPKGLILYLIFPVIVLVIVLLQCLPSSSVQSYRINIAKAL